MTEKRPAIRFSGVGKEYRLGAIGGRTLQAELQSRRAHRRGLEDPNSPIGTDAAALGKKFWALRDIDLTVYPGERVGIIGANGAGKSTLLKLICRITAPTAGEIDLYGRVSSMLEVGTGFHGEMTGRENIYMNGAILGMRKAEIDEKLEDIIDFSGVREFIDTPVKRYSSGMFVRLAFAVAAHLDSEILIMDEVLAVGDAAFQEKCLAKMREAAALEGRTVLYVSHNLNTIRALCDRCLVLSKGRLVFDGEPEAAIACYLNRSPEGSAADLDLTGMEHAGEPGDSALRMTHLTLRGKSEPVYDNREELALRLRLDVAQPLRDAQLRLTFRSTADGGIATAWSPPMDFPAAGEAEAEFTMPLRAFEAGTMYCSIGFYQADDSGRMRRLDHITRAFRLEIGPGVGSPRWDAQAYGHLRLEGLRGAILPSGAKSEIL